MDDSWGVASGAGGLEEDAGEDEWCGGVKHTYPLHQLLLCLIFFPLSHFSVTGSLSHLFATLSYVLGVMNDAPAMKFSWSRRLEVERAKSRWR